MTAENVIHPASTECAAPIIFLSKKDRSLRFCVDYRKQNAVNIRNSYPLRPMYKFIDSLGEETMFCTLDASSRYWTLEINERNRQYSVYVPSSSV